MERLKTLELFGAVAELESFSKAAQLFNLSPSIVSRAIQGLEMSLGVRLLNRTTRKVALTTVGKSVLERVRNVLDGYEEIATIGRNDAQEPHGDIRFDLHSLYGVRRVAPVLVQFMETYPKVRIDLRIVDTADDLIDHSADLAITARGPIPSTYVARSIDTLLMSLYASPSFLLRIAMPAHPNELKPSHCIAPRDNVGEETIELYHAASGERFPLSTASVFRVDKPDAIAQAVSSGLGIGLLPDYAADPYVFRGELVQVLGDWQSCAMPVSLIYPSRHLIPMRVRRLIDHLVQSFSDLRALGTESPQVPPGACVMTGLSSHRTCGGDTEMRTQAFALA